MKAMILAGGLGTRLAEETGERPKPLVYIGERPILWHIMKHLSHYGIEEFIICLGYKGEMIREYFLNYGIQNSDMTVDLSDGSHSVHHRRSENWKVSLVETGKDSMTGGRVKIASRYLNPDEPFLLTYGDGVGNVDIGKLVAFHNTHGKQATVTAVTPPGRFGILDIDRSGAVTGFREKIASDQYKVNAGFFILTPAIADRIAGPETVFEKEPLESLVADNELAAYGHDGFWMPMDTLRDKQALDRLWNGGDPPWAVWQ